ncbi:hypothetical protein [Streptomyces sp. NPDC050145]|uniref:hypothetical protein n=1 Tax=Streptomyces sp. NPDC050145 TaxID=3365602 RepID=UPI00378FF2A9
MRRTASWPATALTAAVLALATPVCADARADGDDTPWESESSWSEPAAPVDPADSAEPADPLVPEGDAGLEDPAEDPAEVPSTRSTGKAPGALELSPADARPGATVTANTSACRKDRRATGDANSLGAGDFPLQTTTQRGDLVGQFQVPSGARPGTYPVSVTCESGSVVRQTLTVSGSGGGQMHGVHAGDGGSLGQIGPVQLGLGGLLITGALGAAGYYTWRRALDR